MSWVPRSPLRRIGGIIAVATAVILALLIAWRFTSRGDATDQAPAPPPARVLDRSGEPTVIVDAAALQRAGIATTPLAAVAYRRHVPAYGSVVDVEALATARSAIASAQAAALRARVAADAAHQELERTRTLYADQQNVSTKALQAAEAADRAAAAEEAAAVAAQRAQGAIVLQAWGPVVGRWVMDGAAELDGLLSRRRVLILLSLPPDILIPSPPAHVAVRAGGGAVEATYLSPATRTDARIQGAGLFYTAPGAASLLPGMTVAAALPTGQRTAAARVPRSAVVWAEGGAWVYVQTGPTTFVRRVISTDAPTDNGYAVTTLAPGTSVVTRGAQFLLSEEYRSQAHAAVGDGDG